MTDTANILAQGQATTTGAKDKKTIALQLPLPCITILVHGVNDLGEAYQAQEEGICRGLNERLNRSHSLKKEGDEGRGDLTPSGYRMPSTDKKDPLVENPDTWYFQPTPDANTWSPVIPFFWGFSEAAGKVVKTNLHGQWTDRHGNRLDKNGTKGGGPFANATSSLEAMWDGGFKGEVGGSEMIARQVSSGDPTHDLRKAQPRTYMLIAARRLAMLIKLIRKGPGGEMIAINFVCHSQGTMVTMLAHAILADEGGNKSADTLIFQNSPYSINEAYFGNDDNQQTSISRITTLSNIFRYVAKCKKTTVPLSVLEQMKTEKNPVPPIGPNWKAGDGAMRWVRTAGKAMPFRERDNRGKVYLYFSPMDATVGLMNVQGIGWSGIPEEVKTTLENGDSGNYPALANMGANFRQRIFTRTKVDGKQFQVGLPVQMHTMRGYTDVASGNHVGSRKSLPLGSQVYINGEELNPPVTPFFESGEEKGHEGTLAVGPVDAANAVAASGLPIVATEMTDPRRIPVAPIKLTPEEYAKLENSLPGQSTSDNPDDRLHITNIRPGIPGKLQVSFTKKSANQLRREYRQSSYADNSYHSAIPANPDHAEGVTAYDLSLNMPLVPDPVGKTSYWEFIRAVANWRTDWS
ncbi:MAG: DUF3274 domain-containing protein, partial [Burkholderiales bacterium]|nr:DUF3274 domain-containing protein [Burkholderiales bacterium]